MSNPKPPRFTEFVGYVAEVAEPNGPRIQAYFVDDWAKRAQSRFEQWLEEHDAEVRSRALSPVLQVQAPHYAYQLRREAKFGRSGSSCMCEICLSFNALGGTLTSTTHEDGTIEWRLE